MFKRLSNFFLGLTLTACAAIVGGNMLWQAFTDSDVLVTRVLAQSATIQSGTTWLGHFNVARSGAAPTVTGGTLQAGSGDYVGRVTGPAFGVAVVVTFGTAFKNAPICKVNSEGFNSTGPIYSATTTALTITAVAGGIALNYSCVGMPS